MWYIYSELSFCLVLFVLASLDSIRIIQLCVIFHPERSFKLYVISHQDIEEKATQPQDCTLNFQEKSCITF